MKLKAPEEARKLAIESRLFCQLLFTARLYRITHYVLKRAPLSCGFCLISAAPSKAPPPPPPPPPPPGEEKKDEAPAAAEEEEEEEEKDFELPFKILGQPVKIPRLPKLPKLPPLPDWLRAILEYRFPSSIDPFTGEQRLCTHEL